jgi:hypothetical protein
VERDRARLARVLRVIVGTKGRRSAPYIHAQQRGTGRNGDGLVGLLEELAEIGCELLRTPGPRVLGVAGRRLPSGRSTGRILGPTCVSAGATARGSEPVALSAPTTSASAALTASGVDARGEIRVARARPFGRRELAR